MTAAELATQVREEKTKAVTPRAGKWRLEPDANIKIEIPMEDGRFWRAAKIKDENRVVVEIKKLKTSKKSDSPIGEGEIIDTENNLGNRSQQGTLLQRGYPVRIRKWEAMTFLPPKEQK